MLQPSQPSLDDLIEARQFLFEIATAGGGDAVGLPTVLRLNGTNTPTLIQARDRSIQRSRAQADIRKTLDVEHHGVAVFSAIGQAGKYEKSWI
jgi:hypothetical protein